MAKKKHPNPNRVPVHLTEADIKRIKREATDEGMNRAIRLMLYVLIDKHDAPMEDLQQLAQELNHAAGCVSSGLIKWRDIDKLLDEEYDIEIELY